MLLMKKNLTEKSIRTTIPRNSQLTHNDVKARKRNALHCSFAPAEKLNQNYSFFSPCKTARDAGQIMPRPLTFLKDSTNLPNNSQKKMILWYNKHMKIYLDNCCYNRPYDDQSYLSISLETQAKMPFRIS